MKSVCNRTKLRAVAAAIAMSFSMGSGADDIGGDPNYEALAAEVDALQKQLRQVQEKMKQYEQGVISQQEAEALRQEVAEVSKATSEWTNTDSVVHLAGYGAVTYSDSDSSEVNGAFSGVQFNPIFHYQYKNLLMLEAELEMEIEEDGSSDIGMEYLTVDLFINDYLTAVAGQFLSPIGQFRQNLHPAWINKLPTAPSGFGHDGAAPVSETGLQARGGFPLGSRPVYANYSVYVGNGPRLEVHDGEIEHLEAEGSTSNDDDRLVWGGRIGLLPVPRLEIGLSAATGEVAAEDELSARRDYDVFGADFAWTWNRLRLRGEYVEQEVGSEASSEAPESAEWKAWYAEGSYRFLPSGWEGVVRYSDFDSPHDDDDQSQWALGVNYLFAPNAMVKLAYNFNDGEEGSESDEDAFQVQFAYGF